MSTPAVSTPVAVPDRRIAGGREALSSMPSSASRFLTLTIQSLREQWRGILIWGVSLGLLNVMYVSLYPGFKDSLGKYMETMPSGYLEFLGINAGGGQFSLQSFLNMEMFGIIAPIALPFFVILMGARAVAGAEDRTQLDLLLSNPVPRRHLIASKFVTMIVGSVVILAILWVLTYVPSLFLSTTLPANDLTLAVLNLLPFSLFFGGLALLLSALLRRSAIVIAISAALLVAMYVVNGMANVVASFKRARVVSLFYYYGAAIIDGIHWIDFFVVLVIAFVLAVLAAVAFDRRDILT
jgi:ABC-2 type transport system permease protein